MYTGELRQVREEIERVIALLESAPRDLAGREIGEVNRRLALAAELMARPTNPSPAAASEALLLRSALRQAHQLVKLAAGFYRGWSAIACVAPAAYNASGHSSLPAARSSSLAWNG